MSTIGEIPEIAGLDARSGLIRIPPELDVPLTGRVRQILDAPEFRRLARISQLGLVGLVYPAAHHSRLEHSLGVYRLALLVLRRLADDERFSATVAAPEAERFLLAALLHDLGHWPFCHPIEDLQLPSVPTHELFANSFLLEGEIADALRHDWGVNPRDVMAILSGTPDTRCSRLLHSMLSGPIDIDKMDYLMRDSLHAGVPYGRNFDQSRLIRSLCLGQDGDCLAISEKGKTAAEMMVFARYVMFSEVYWHHGVRAATAMLQRAFYWLHGGLDLDALFRLTEGAMIDQLRGAAAGGPAEPLLEGLFGPTRRLYKRLLQITVVQHGELYRSLARRPYAWLAACAEQLAALASTALGQVVAPHEILLDAPPMQREVEFNIPVWFTTERCYRPLGEISPVVRALAQQQFDDHVKRVRVFVHPRIAVRMRGLSKPHRLLEQAVERMV
ncbi:MAG: metal-dependent phosphohydrolase [Planctomycetes bacterium RBG_16_64_10]|nr:MAG: metal-dependent phosphohydrolase [Planctomycetes bacterium RBG_16_64_10]